VLNAGTALTGAADAVDGLDHDAPVIPIARDPPSRGTCH
jgi:hypothetical protein